MKPLKVKPQFYAVCLEQLQEIAKELGYNLVVHGSMNRDMDLIAVPWVDDPKPHLELLQALEKHLTGSYFTTPEDYMFSILPGGRHSYVINLNRGPKYSHADPQWYIDISITPLGI